MSTLAVHFAMGLLLAAVLRVPLRYVPLGGVLAVLPDLDHLEWYAPLPGVYGGVTLHNVWVLVVLPAAAYVALVVWDRWQDHRHLVAKATPVLASHLVLDLFPLDAGGGAAGARALFWPVSAEWFTWTASPALGSGVFAVGVAALGLGLVALLALGTVVAVDGASWRLPDRVRSALGRVRDRLAGLVPLGLLRRLGRLRPLRPPLDRTAAFAAAWLLVFPLLAAAGVLAADPARDVEADLAVQDAQVDPAEGRLVATVVHAEGRAVGQGKAAVELWAHGTRLVRTTNPDTLFQGGTWQVDLPVGASGTAAAPTGLDLATAELTVRLVVELPGGEVRHEVQPDVVTAGGLL